MGSGTWTTSGYAHTASKIASGKTFAYDARTKRSGIYRSHEALDPKVKAKSGPYKGQVIRESRDSDEHPNSTPIIIGFDSTGSMGSIPRTVQTKLSDVFGLLTRKGYAQDPQIAITTYGDAFVDSVPLQFSQFESDNRIDDNLDKLFLEGGGGGNGGETASLMFYLAAHHTATDSWEKRHKKGYIFLIADERMLDLQPNQVKAYIGVDEAKSTRTLDIVEAVKEKWEVVVLLIDNMSAKMQNSYKHYTQLFGEDHVLLVENPDTIAETIAASVGFLEGTVGTAEELSEDMTDIGAKDLVVREVTQTVSKLNSKKETVLQGSVGGTGAGAARF